MTQASSGHVHAHQGVAAVAMPQFPLVVVDAGERAARAELESDIPQPGPRNRASPQRSASSRGARWHKARPEGNYSVARVSKDGAAGTSPIYRGAHGSRRRARWFVKLGKAVIAQLLTTRAGETAGGTLESDAQCEQLDHADADDEHCQRDGVVFEPISHVVHDAASPSFSPLVEAGRRLVQMWRADSSKSGRRIKRFAKK
jgi:hypothetical protein